MQRMITSTIQSYLVTVDLRISMTQLSPTSESPPRTATKKCNTIVGSSTTCSRIRWSTPSATSSTTSTGIGSRSPMQSKIMLKAPSETFATSATSMISECITINAFSFSMRSRKKILIKSMIGAKNVCTSSTNNIEPHLRVGLFCARILAYPLRQGGRDSQPGPSVGWSPCSSRAILAVIRAVSRVFSLFFGFIFSDSLFRISDCSFWVNGVYCMQIINTDDHNKIIL